MSIRASRRSDRSIGNRDSGPRCKVGASGRNIRLTIEYDGRNYCGWQVQNSPRSAVCGPRKKSVQGTLEKSLRKILQKTIKVIGSGRTDSGAHALAQVANFKTNSGIPLERLHAALNVYLPDDIVVTAAEEAGAEFHSRFCAKSKAYRYTVLNRAYPSVFLRNRAYFFRYPLDVKIMQKESRILLGRHDFSSFRSSGSGKSHFLKTIKDIKVSKDKDLVYIDIEADGFLYNMARNIAGTLLEIGRGRFKKGDLKKILSARNRRLAGPTLPARGLSLIKVNY